jgi:putative DNA primase/helicase
VSKRSANSKYADAAEKAAATLCIAEGFATGATIHQATGYPVAVAFNAGNLEAVAKAMRQKLPGLSMIVCADDDAGTEGNPGITKANLAALATGAKVAVPAFGDQRPDDASDFNDMAARARGKIRICKTNHALELRFREGVLNILEHQHRGRAA